MPPPLHRHRACAVQRPPPAGADRGRRSRSRLGRPPRRAVPPSPPLGHRRRRPAGPPALPASVRPATTATSPKPPPTPPEPRPRPPRWPTGCAATAPTSWTSRLTSVCRSTTTRPNVTSAWSSSSRNLRLLAHPTAPRRSAPSAATYPPPANTATDPRRPANKPATANPGYPQPASYVIPSPILYSHKYAPR